MIKRVKKTCSLILLATAITSIVPTGLMNTAANAAISSNSNERTAGAYTDEQILGILTNSINNIYTAKYPGCTVEIGLPLNFPLKLDSNMEKIIATQVCSNDETVKKLLIKQKVTEIEKQYGSKLPQEEINKMINQVVNGVNSMTSEQVNSVRPDVEKVVVQIIDDQYNGKPVTVYNYKVMVGTEEKDQGFFVAGQLGGLYYELEKKPLMVSGTELNTTIKNKITQAIKKNLGAIIASTGIKDIINDVKDTVNDVTDAIGDLSDSLDDLADSLHDKSDDVDDAWDKVFDRFDNEPGWGKRDGYIYYYDEDGISLKGPQTIEGKTYYFNRIDGAMETGWQIVDGKRCYFDKKKGYELFSQWVQDGDDWYFLSADGAVEKSKWLNYGPNWYYLKADGKMAKGWLKIDDYWYYLNSGNGAMAYSQWILYDDNSKWRYVTGNGAAANDWEYINGNWYHFKKESAQMETGWFRADGNWYYADSNGAMQTGWVSCKDGWCYLDTSSGKMKKNEWAYSNGNWYYFNVNGIMVTGKRYIDGTKYIFNSDGTLA
ncbi:MAG TPA: PspC family transcriptional regulator [Clostridium sp.]|nr:PspC family transcriptional regulator [Clostridium sp.]